MYPIHNSIFSFLSGFAEHLNYFYLQKKSHWMLGHLLVAQQLMGRDGQITWIKKGIRWKKIKLE